MVTLAVGHPYPMLVPPLPEAGEFLAYDGGLELRIFYRAPTAQEVRALRYGVASFALAYHEELI